MNAMNPTKSLEFKLVVMGSAGVGKTSLVQRYIRNTFSPATSTVGASFVTKRVFDNASDTLVRLQIWDTAGQERFRSISRLYYRGAHACVLCYDITDENSFNEMTGWLRELRHNIDDGDADPLIIHVVGTKSDIVAQDPASRRVPFERTIAYVAEQLDPNRAGTPPASAMMEPSYSNSSHNARETTRGSASTSVASISGSGFFGQPPGSAGGLSNGSALLSPDSKRSSAFWGQEVGWDCCHEISAKDGEGIDEVFRVITRKLVEQRNRRDAELALSAAASPPEGFEGFPPMDGTGSFRLGHGDKRRSWLGLTSPGPSLGAEMEETELMLAARERGRCC